MVTTYGTDWSLAAAKAALYDESLATRRDLKEARAEIQRLKKRPLRFLLRCWIGREKRH